MKYKHTGLFKEGRIAWNKGKTSWSKGLTLKEMYPDEREREIVRKKLSDSAKKRVKKEVSKICRQCGKEFLATLSYRYCHNPCGGSKKRNINDKRNQKTYRRERKIEVLRHYGNGKVRCACCGELHIEFLVLDHLNGGGNKHRKSIFGQVGRGDIYRWVIKNNYPKGFRVLCDNCNASIGRYGYCPHKV